MNAEQGPEMEDGREKRRRRRSEAREGGRDSAERRNEDNTAQSAATVNFTS